MKTKSIFILFALVMILSLSAGVFAQEDAFVETWDEETVVTVFSDLDLMFPDLFAPEDSDYLWEDEPTFWRDFRKNDKGTPVAKDVTLEDIEAKAGIADFDTKTGTRFKSLQFDACGDGLIKFDIILVKDVNDEGDLIPGDNSGWTGPSRTTYIRDLTVTVGGEKAEFKTCSSTGGDKCRSVKFNNKGEAHLKGYIYAPQILQPANSSMPGPEVKVTIIHSTYRSAFYNVEKEEAITVTGNAEMKRNYCQPSLQQYSLAGMPAVRAKYDPNTGEARFQATIINGYDPALVPPFSTDYEPGYAPKDANYVIPAEVIDLVPAEEGDEPIMELEDGTGYVYNKKYTKYTCKYTLYNTANAAPRTDYCKFGEGIYLAPHAVIRFDITIDHLNGDTLRTADGGDILFLFRVGGLTYFINDGTMPLTFDGSSSNAKYHAMFEPVRFPCPPVTRMLVKDPLYPFMGEPFYGMDSDKTIEASGPYGVYENGVWGIYQKCGKYAFMAVRLKNDGVKDETINLKKVAVAINGGTPVKWNWVLTSVSEDSKDKIVLEPGETVFLMLRAKVTDYPYQLNADTAMTGAVNFTDFGLYITGKVFSDHNNTRCVAAPK